MIGLIAARSKNNVIGKDGKIPWRIRGEQKQFKELTTGNVVIMGRKSYEEIGHPLPNRMNIIVSGTLNLSGPNIATARSLEEALRMAEGRDVFISGGYGLFKEAIGYGLFKEAIPIVERMYLTEVDLEVPDGDVFFPDFDENDFEKEVIGAGGDEIRFTRMLYTRKV